jgi:hypothetical protein
MVRKSTIVFGAVGAAVLGGTAWAAYQRLTTPRMSHSVVDRVGDVEIRRYPTTVVVETTAPGREEAFRRLFRYITGANRADEEISMTAPVETESGRVPPDERDVATGRAGDDDRSAVAGGGRVPMTAPVELGRKIPMTAPVETEADSGPRDEGDESAGERAGEASEAGVRMAFHLPESYDYESAPRPTDPSVRLLEVPERTLAVLGFSWRPSDRRVASEVDELLATLDDDPGLSVVGDPFLLVYDAPWTPPFLRTNEVAVEVRRGARGE